MINAQLANTGSNDRLDDILTEAVEANTVPYSVTLTASGSVKSTPGRLHRVIIDAVGSSPTIKLHNGSSASDAALLGATARVPTVGTLYDFGDEGISFDALYFALGVSTMTAIFQVS